MARYSKAAARVRIQSAVSAAVAVMISFGILSTSALASSVGMRELIDREASALGKTVRIQHAKELLGKFYKTSVVREVEKAEDVHEYIQATTAASLPKKFRKQAKKIADAIIREAYKHKFDPLFVMAVISTESGFQPTIVGKDGEIGLMQIMPKTAQWISKICGIKYKGKKTLNDPVANIRIATAFLARLRENFDSHSRLYLAAYNMGGGNVKKALGKKIWPKEYPVRVMAHYVSFYAELKQADVLRDREVKAGRVVARDEEDDSES